VQLCVTAEAPPLREFPNLNSGPTLPAPSTRTFFHPQPSSHIHLPFFLSRDPWYLSVKMAAAIKAINAKIRSNKVLDYFCSTREFSQLRISAQFVGTASFLSTLWSRMKLTPCADFWGPASNFGIPVAAVMDIQKDPEMCVLKNLFSISFISSR
jgi:hypothetical protein